MFHKPRSTTQNLSTAHSLAQSGPGSMKMGLMLLELTVKPINRGRNVVLAAMSNLLADDDQEEAKVEYKYK